MSYETSDRGFRHYEPLLTDYGHEIRVYESSSANSPHLWIATELTEEMSRGAHSGIAPESTHAHLTLDQAVELRDRIDQAIANHYQVRGTR